MATSIVPFLCVITRNCVFPHNVFKYSANLATFTSSSAASISSKTQNGAGFIFNIANSKAIAVKEITIGSRLLEKMPNAIIYDIPGFNSPTEMHQQQTRTRMKSADAIVIIAKADEPSLTGEVLDIFRECDNDGTVLNDKLFVFNGRLAKYL